MRDLRSGSLSPDLPVPVNDGGCNHLPDTRVPSVALPSTSGGVIDFTTARGTTVVYVYPHTGLPDLPTPKEWDLIPGARGCTPEACAFRDGYAELRGLGAHVYGLSTDSPEWQREAVDRLHLPFELVSDSERAWSKALRLPTFEFQGRIFLKRLTLILEDDRVRHVFYPVFPPDTHAQDVIAFLRRTR